LSLALLRQTGPTVAVPTDRPQEPPAAPSKALSAPDGPAAPPASGFTYVDSFADLLAADGVPADFLPRGRPTGTPLQAGDNSGGGGGGGGGGGHGGGAAFSAGQGGGLAAPVGTAGGQGAVFDGPGSQPATPASAAGRGRSVAPATVSPTPPYRPPPPPRHRPPGHGVGDPLYVLDAINGLVLSQDATQTDFAGAPADLRAQVSGANVSTYTWTFSNPNDVTNVTGLGTYDLQFKWGSFTDTRTETVSVTTGTETQTIEFSVIGTASNQWTNLSANPVTTADTWHLDWQNPAQGLLYVLTPDSLSTQEAAVSSSRYSVSLAAGDLQVSHALPAYNPNVDPLGLTYSSSAADPTPVFLAHYILDPNRSGPPATVSATLTFPVMPAGPPPGPPPTTYSTNLLNPGDVLEIALQGDATTLTTGRYGYQVSVTATYPDQSTETTAASGNVSVLNYAHSPFGPGWSLDGQERLYLPADNSGALLDLGGGRSLWYTLLKTG
jgi:hypothetical protein